MIKAVTYILENDATVQGIVGTKTNEDVDTYHKVFPVVAPVDETVPYCVARLVGKEPMGKPPCDHMYSIEVASVSGSYDAVTTLNDAVIAALIGQAAGTVNGVDFGSLTFANEADDYEKEHGFYIKRSTFQGIAA